VVHADASDDDLVKAACRGDVDSFAELYRRHVDKAVAIAYCQLLDRGLAEDAAQESFAEACRQLHSLRNGAKFAYWLGTICRRIAGRMIKSKRFCRELPEQELVAPAAADSHSDAVRAAVAQLPASAKEVIVMHYFGDLSHDEIAATLDISPSAVHGRLVRAREQLRRQLAHTTTGAKFP
jgi:RNA polymerase sigma-70 factor (ECF subfamily)